MVSSLNATDFLCVDIVLLDVDSCAGKSEQESHHIRGESAGYKIVLANHSNLIKEPHFRSLSSSQLVFIAHGSNDRY